MKQTTMNRTSRAVCTVLAAAALAAGLAACAPLIVGGAVVGGVMAVDRRTTGTQIEDEGIELRAANRIRETLGDRVQGVMNAYAAQHNGIAPVVVMPDASGGQVTNPLCTDSNLGNVGTYLSKDLPNAIKSQLRVDPRPDMSPNPDEVAEWAWTPLARVREAVEGAPFAFSPWMVRQLDEWNGPG